MLCVVKSLCFCELVLVLFCPYVYCSIREKVFSFYNICKHTVSGFFSGIVLYWDKKLTNLLIRPNLKFSTFNGFLYDIYGFFKYARVSTSEEDCINAYQLRLFILYYR